MTGRVVSVNVSPGGVPKRPVPRTWIGPRGLDTDAHAEPEPSHGGPEQAVCLYTVESIARLAAEGHRAFPGALGENLTLEGIELGDLRRGDRLELGDGGPVLELTGRAEPCQTNGHWFVERRISRISSKVHPEDARWYARVLAEGWVAPGDAVVMRRSVRETVPEVG